MVEGENRSQREGVGKMNVEEDTTWMGQEMGRRESWLDGIGIGRDREDREGVGLKGQYCVWDWTG
jgi:hypothetical protein